MATLHVGNFPNELHKALKAQAKKNGRSMSAETTDILRRFVPTPADLRKRRKLFALAARLRAKKPLGPGPFPSTEEMQREMREEEEC